MPKKVVSYMSMTDHPTYNKGRKKKRSKPRPKEKKDKPKKKSEKEVQTDILNWLKWKRIFAYKTPTQGQVFFGNDGVGHLAQAAMRGVCDITGVLPGGRALYIEVKRPGWKPPSEEALERAYQGWLREDKKDHYATFRAQRAFQRSATKAGALVLVATELDTVIDCVEAYLRSTGFEVSGSAGATKN